ncbi:OsmC family protein [Vibrio palustris]|uniref:OsmC-like protein n=1 Tax=Vibrio palustris TaxID=1918946 RepID=A0A1R4B4I6_9VIBR|nr:OsmC family protein [Vibrio palustris]SJL83832.1 hypothetical protein VPAL9027_01811 [Vibrio palustris]
MSVSVKWQQGHQFKVTTGNQQDLAVDTDDQTAPCATDVLLSALGTSCTNEVIAQLNNHGVELVAVQAQLTYTLTEAQPRLFDSINLHYIIKGTGMTEVLVTRVLSSAIHECSHVSLMLTPAVNLTYSYHVVKLAA